MEVSELLDEAAEARVFASEMKDTASARDLIQYAAALEAEAAKLLGGKTLGRHEGPSPGLPRPAIGKPDRSVNPGRRAS